jgi:membrane protease YdiL (CAAX protease family)
VAATGARAAERPPAGPAPGAPGAAGERPWPWWSAIVVLLAGWLTGQVVAGIVITVGGGGTAEDDTPIGLLALGTAAFDIVFVAIVVVLARLFGGASLERFALRPISVRRALPWVAGGLVASYVAASIWLAALGATDEEDTITDRLTSDPPVAGVVGLAILTVVIAPIVEEVVFRGFVFRALQSAMPMAAAAVVSGVLFGAVHAAGSPWEFLVPLSVFGVILALVTWRTGSLHSAIAMHAVWNSVMFGGAMGWDWQILALLAGSGACITAIMAAVHRTAAGAALRA